MSEIKVSASGLTELRRQLGEATSKVLDKGERTVGQGMNNIKKDAQKRVRAGNFAHLPHLPRSYDYDVHRRGAVITGTAGANRNKPQGKLDVYVEYGTPTSAPHPHWGPALEAELPRFQKYVADLGVEALER